MMIRSALLFAAMAAGGCASGTGTLLVTVDSDRPLPPVAVFTATVTQGTARAIALFMPPMPVSVGPGNSQTFTLVTPRDRSGPASLVVDAMDPQRQQVGHGSATIDLEPGTAAAVTVHLNPGMMMPMPDGGGPDLVAQNDLAPPPDLASYDLTLLPPVDLAGPPGPDGGMGGPKTCTMAADCLVPGSCPPGSQGCACVAPPMTARMICVATCMVTADCPMPRPGHTFMCMGGFCAEK
jgi:hypothetical protein